VRKKIVVILLSFVFAFIVMSGGYGFWQKKLIIEGVITVVPEENIMMQTLQVTTSQAIQVTTGQTIELVISDNDDLRDD